MGKGWSRERWWGSNLDARPVGAGVSRFCVDVEGVTNSPRRGGERVHG